MYCVCEFVKGLLLPLLHAEVELFCNIQFNFLFFFSSNSISFFYSVDDDDDDDDGACLSNNSTVLM